MSDRGAPLAASNTTTPTGQVSSFPVQVELASDELASPTRSTSTTITGSSTTPRWRAASVHLVGPSPRVRGRTPGLPRRSFRRRGRRCGCHARTGPADSTSLTAAMSRWSTVSDLTRARSLPANGRVAFVADQKGGPFDVPADRAREWLVLPANPNGRLNADVLKPWVNGMDLTRRPAGKWIVDFGWTMSVSDAALFAESTEPLGPVTRSRFGGSGRTSTRCAVLVGARLIESAGGGTLTRDRACGERSMECHVALPRRPSPSTGCSSGATCASARTISWS